MSKGISLTQVSVAEPAPTATGTAGQVVVVIPTQSKDKFGFDEFGEAMQRINQKNTAKNHPRGLHIVGVTGPSKSGKRRAMNAWIAFDIERGFQVLEDRLFCGGRIVTVTLNKDKYAKVDDDLKYLFADRQYIAVRTPICDSDMKMHNEVWVVTQDRKWTRTKCDNQFPANVNCPSCLVVTGGHSQRWFGCACVHC
jgi:hypothetical protein